MGAGTDDVIDLASFQKARNGFVREPVIGVKQPDHLAAQLAQRGIDERQGVAGRLGAARAQPEVGHDPGQGDKARQRVIRGQSSIAGVVCPCRAFLFPMASDHRGVDVEGDARQRSDLAEKSAIDGPLYRFVAGHVEALEHPDNRPVSRRSGPAKQPGQGAAEAHGFGMDKKDRPCTRWRRSTA